MGSYPEVFPASKKAKSGRARALKQASSCVALGKFLNLSESQLISMIVPVTKSCFETFSVAVGVVPKIEVNLSIPATLQNDV